MPLQPGQQLAHYRLTERIGEGGMGVVWRGEDTKLGRSVAIKVLPDLFASDPERLARFEREAKLLAALNHPNIGAIHGLEEADGVRFLVLELVGGQTLAERLAGGPLPTDEALDIARQIAEALGAAHEQGILHRDLKPANIKITDVGKVKVLDFGLAKAVEPSPGETSLSASPTLTTGGTAAGVIIGTAAYMAPEQARGKAVDKRADVWAFGCVLFECLTARKIFTGETITDILGAILHREPEWSLLPAGLPASIPRLLRRCLQRDPRQRLHDIADARIILEEAAVERTQIGTTAREAAGRRGPAAWVLAAGGILIAAAGFLAGRSLGPAAPTRAAPGVRFTLVHAPVVDAVPGRAARFVNGIPPLAFSPGGERIAYAVRDADGISRLYLRELDELEAHVLRGSDGAHGPFFSPDGEWIGFESGGEMRAIRVSGGTPRTVARAGSFKGAGWTRDDAIVFAPGADTGLWRVSADGGDARTLTTPDPEHGERTHRWPQELPGGRGILVTVGTSTIRTFDDADLAVWVSGTGELKTVFEGGMFGRYVAPGHLLFARDNTLYAVPFDLDRLEVTGRPVAVVDDVMTDPLTGAAAFAVSAGGSLAYVRGKQVEAYELWSIGFDGVEKRVGDRTDYFGLVSVSPDGRFLALGIDGANEDIWVYDLERQSMSRFTFEWNNLSPRWTPDGRKIAYMRGRAGTGDLFWRSADGSGEPEELLANPFIKLPGSFSPDGKVLAYTQRSPETGSDLWVLDLETRTAKPFLQTPFEEYGPVFSPDGAWIAYASDETGRPEIFVRPYPGPGGKWQISIDGASQAGWAPDGKSLVFGADGVFRVPVETASGFRAGRPERILTTDLRITAYDFRPDGRGAYAVVVADTEPVPTEVQVMVNWAEHALADAD